MGTTFQFQYGASEGSINEAEADYNYANFNSSMVRVKVKFWNYFFYTYTIFQFQYGASEGLADTIIRVLDL